MEDKMYKKAATLFANALYDELISSQILDDPNILCGQTDEPISLNKSQRADHNFILWSLIPYITACSGEKLIKNAISFEEVATIRPDGGHNIFYASVYPTQINLLSDCVPMKHWCGPFWNQNDKNILWRIDSEWSENRLAVNNNDGEIAKRVLSLYQKEMEEGNLSKDDYAWLAEQGFVKTNGDYEGSFKSSWQVVILLNNEIKEKLLSIGEKIKEKHKNELDQIKAPYVKAVLSSIPAHLKKVKEYELQYTFHSDGWFLLHCYVALLSNGKLKLPTEGQRKSLSTVIIPK